MRSNTIEDQKLCRYKIDVSEIKIGHQVKKAETWLKLISTGDRAEFQFLKSVNTLAEFPLKKGEKKPSPSWRNFDWLPVCDGIMHLIPPINVMAVGHRQEKKLQQ